MDLPAFLTSQPSDDKDSGLSVFFPTSSWPASYDFQIVALAYGAY